MANKRFTLPVAAHRIGASYRQVYDVVLSGRLKAERVDGRWLVREDALEEFLRERDNRTAQSE